MNQPIDYITLILRELGGVTDQDILDRYGHNSDGLPTVITAPTKDIRAAIERRVTSRIEALQAQVVSKGAHELIKRRREELCRMINQQEDQLDRLQSARRDPGQNRIDTLRSSIDRLRAELKGLG